MPDGPRLTRAAQAARHPSCRGGERWFDATERYARQLHEMDRATYLAMKQREYARQQALAAQ